MKKFRYTAYNLERKKFSGFYFANNEEHLRQLLCEQQLFLVSCKVVNDKSSSAFLSLVGKVKMKELTHFCRQLAIMINSSIELVKCLDILRKQSYSKYLQQIITELYEDVKTGILLSEAMKKHKKVFPEFFRNMVYIGEMSSSLEHVLENVADYYENETRIKSRVKSSLVYPIVLLIMTLGIIALMMIVVVPTFKVSLADMDIEMPALTQAIFNGSDFVVKNWYYIFLGLVLFIVLIKLFSKTKSGKCFFDTLSMKIGFIKRYQVAKLTSKFSRSFGLLIGSGMHIVDAMEVVKKIIGNVYIEKRFEVAIEEVRKGVGLTQALSNMKVFPNMLLQMVAVGEKTADMDKVLLKSCGYFDEQLNNAINGITSLLQPVLMVFMGISIGVIFIAIYSPMLSIMQNLG